MIALPAHATHNNLPPGLGDCIRSISATLQERNVDSPRLSAEVLVAAALGKSRPDMIRDLILNEKQLLPQEALRKAHAYCLRRAGGEPVAYIVGEKEFYGRDFTVSPDVLVPRPETELLIELALSAANKPEYSSHPFFADFGTGSGCIAITLALEMPGWRGLALDKSAGALTLAESNAAKLGAAERLSFALGDFAKAPLAPRSLALLVSNPPYIGEEEYGELSPEVRWYEPKSALVPDQPQSCPPLVQDDRQDQASGDELPEQAQATGLECALAIIRQASDLLRPGGTLLLEIGCAQGRKLVSVFDPKKWKHTVLHTDLAGLDRVIEAVLRD